MTDEPSLTEQCLYWRNQAAHWRIRALAAEAKQNPTHPTPEDPEYKRISYRDSTGEKAAARADRAKTSRRKP